MALRTMRGRGFEVHCDGSDCDELGGRGLEPEEARALALANQFHHHSSPDGVDVDLDLCPRCSRGCSHCARAVTLPPPADEVAS